MYYYYIIIILYIAKADLHKLTVSEINLVALHSDSFVSAPTYVYICIMWGLQAGMRNIKDDV